MSAEPGERVYKGSEGKQHKWSLRRVLAMIRQTSLYLAVALLAGSSAAAGELKSGPQVGESNNRSGFKPQFITGPTAGKPVCPV